MKLQKLITNVQQWSIDRGLDKADSKKQLLKLYEEFGELASGLAKGDKEGVKLISGFELSHENISKENVVLEASEYIGAVSNFVKRNLKCEGHIVYLITYIQRIAKDEGLKFEDCLSLAWNEIKDRKGKLIDGVWVKGEDLK